MSLDRFQGAPGPPGSPPLADFVPGPARLSAVRATILKEMAASRQPAAQQDFRNHERKYDRHPSA